MGKMVDLSVNVRKDPVTGKHQIFCTDTHKPRAKTEWSRFVEDEPLSYADVERELDAVLSKSESS
jgi:hypothetical protein